MRFGEAYTEYDLPALDEQHRTAREEATRAIQQSNQRLRWQGQHPQQCQPHPLLPASVRTRTRPDIAIGSAAAAKATGPTPEQDAFASLSPAEQGWAQLWLFDPKTATRTPRTQFDQMITSAPAEWASIIGGYKPGSMGRKALPQAPITPTRLATTTMPASDGAQPPRTPPGPSHREKTPS